MSPPPAASSIEDKLKALEELQRAALNILEDFGAEKGRLEDTQRATLNLLEDFNAEKSQLEQVEKATVNILEDFDTEKIHLLDTQRATLNILHDFDAEKERLEEIQTATVNILDDFEGEKARLEQAQRAVLNILDDFEVEKIKVEVANRELTREITQRQQGDEEIRKLNRNLEERAAELETTNKELEAFSYSVSHDLRAPLRHVDGFSKILLEEYGPQLDPNAQRYLSRVRQGTQNMGQLIDDLLTFSRLGRQPVNRVVSGLNSVVEAVVTGLKPETEGRAVEWRIGQLPFVECDPLLLKQVFANLLSNALKYTRPRNPAVVEVGAQSENGQPVIYVRDNGVGFSMKYAGKLFGVFQRLHRPEDFEGTGVGLATVQRIVHKHGGRVWAQAELDKGATFYFTLESAEAAEPEATKEKSSEVRNEL